MSRTEHFNAGAGIRTEHVKGGSVGEHIVAHVGDQEAGTLDFWHLGGKPNAIGVSEVYVEQQHRGKGVATAMYDHLHRAYPKAIVHHDYPNMSGDGRELGEALTRRHPGKHVFTEL